MRYDGGRVMERRVMMTKGTSPQTEIKTILIDTDLTVGKDVTLRQNQTSLKVGGKCIKLKHLESRTGTR